MTTETKELTRKWTLDLGKVDASGRGRKTNRVTLEVELRRRESCSPHLDIDLKECREYTELSICGNVWNGAGSDIITGGQCVGEIRRLFPTGPVARLVDIWDRWHLNGMKAGTRAQEEFLKANPVTVRVDHYAYACALLEKANLLHVNGPGVTNYKYGSAWLVDRLPDEVEAEVVRLCGELGARADGEPEPKTFAEEHGITAVPVQVESNPNLTDAAPDSKHWAVTLRRGKSRLTVHYTTGSAHTKVPTAIDVLGCLASDAQSADYKFEEWCSEFGFETDSRKAEKTFKAVKKQSAALKRFLGDGLYRALLQDSQG